MTFCGCFNPLGRIRAASAMNCGASAKEPSGVAGRGSMMMENQKIMIVFFHGLGDQGDSWKEPLNEIVDKIKKEVNTQLEVLLPTAPLKKVTINGGMEMRAWYDLYSLNAYGKEDIRGIDTTAIKIWQEIESKMRRSRVNPKNLYIGGFSQGGALALYLVMSGKAQNIGGVFAHSAYLPAYKEHLIRMRIATNQRTPILFLHGKSDSIVNLDWGKMSSEVVKNHFPLTKMITFDKLDHSICPDSIAEISKFIIACALKG